MAHSFGDRLSNVTASVSSRLGTLTTATTATTTSNSTNTKKSKCDLMFDEILNGIREKQKKAKRLFESMKRKKKNKNRNMIVFKIRSKY